MTLQLFSGLFLLFSLFLLYLFFLLSFWITSNLSWIVLPIACIASATLYHQYFWGLSRIFLSISLFFKLFFNFKSCFLSWMFYIVDGVIFLIFLSSLTLCSCLCLIILSPAHAFARLSIFIIVVIVYISVTVILPVFNSYYYFMF